MVPVIKSISSFIYNISEWATYTCVLVHLLCRFYLISDEENSRHVVVNCGEALLKNNTYWPLVSDFINILSHQSVAKKFLEDHSLLMLWMSFVSFFQGKRTSQHFLITYLEFLFKGFICFIWFCGFILLHIV